ncbi:Quinoprotein glucose dehydrogenase B precursor [Gimesia alba]|uniref:Quinoprotein glucose dehydrogenase B n=1 Tax=Gimesia alba TaxID=2527973 RepID=A0A517RKD3_9PLAN|nr:PQQ-dependent sugar dehydrogenase [Gimesia alba]QDT44324.1 Quinoprotein glucose dehydrogenase B precursor [Gimesia alba]
MIAAENLPRFRSWFLFPFIVILLMLPIAHLQAQEPSDSGSGIAKRVPWTTSKIKGTPDPALPYETERAFPNLKFNQPLAIATAPGQKRFFVAERKGKIFSFPYEDQSVSQTDLFFDLKERVKDLNEIYGITFHPQFEKQPFVYICYVLKPGLPAGTRVSRFKVMDTNPPRCDPDSEEILIEWLSGGHNGGCLRFGPDGYLYISTGDGGPASPPDIHNAGQDVSNLLSCVLRIDVDHPGKELPYSIPSDNPFVNQPGARPEIWAFGFRNPWKMCFHPENGDLWVGDVGWELWELVFRVEKGGNYGWSIREGRQPVKPELKPGPTPILPPTIEHSHREARSITGGYFYQNPRLKELKDTYIYGDYSTGKLWGLRYADKRVNWHQELANSTLKVTAFALDDTGEVYIVDIEGGAFHRLVPIKESDHNPKFPTLLSQTGLFESTKTHQVAPGVIPYSINAPAWADYATAERFVALPGDSSVEVVKKQEWKFPKDSVLMKTISLETERGNPQSTRRLETQLLHFNGARWLGYSYRWNEEQTDAELVSREGDNLKLEISSQVNPQEKVSSDWHIPSRAECAVCHTPFQNHLSVLSFEAAQLNRNQKYGDMVDNQIRALAHIKVLPESVWNEAKASKTLTLANPHNASVDVKLRARSYLHANCRHCHRNNGGGGSTIELGASFDRAGMKAVGVKPTQGTFGITEARIISPGDPFRSVLLYRISKLGKGRMPYSGSSMVDVKATQLIREWIERMQTSSDDSSFTVLRLRNYQRNLLADSVQIEDQEFVSQKIQGILGTTSGALLLLDALDQRPMSEQMKDQIIQLGTQDQSPLVSDLFERFIPEDQRVKRLGLKIDEGTLLSIQGDAREGKKLFFEMAGLQCRNCHRVHQYGKELGPDLTQIGKKLSRAELLENIIQPSKKIDEKYYTHVIETQSGKVYTGLLVKKEDGGITIRDSKNELLQIPQNEIESMVVQKKSIMPEQLFRDLTAEQAAHLLAYLESLK